VQIAALPVHRENAELWRRLNDLESGRPRSERFRCGAPESKFLQWLSRAGDLWGDVDDFPGAAPGAE
jgi:hypothetical protein